MTHALDEDFSDRTVLENVASSLDGQYDHLVEHLDLMSSNALQSGSQLLLHEEGSRAGLLDKVNESFGAAESITELHELLKADGSKWATACVEGLEARPSWVAALTFALLKNAAKLSLEDCIQLEHATVANIWARRTAEKDIAASDVGALLSQPEMDSFQRALPLGVYREQRYPFSDHAVQHLDRMWREVQERLDADPDDEPALAKQAKLRTFRGALDEVRWLNVQSTLVRCSLTFCTN